MRNQTPDRLGSLQLRILKVLWKQGEASIANISSALGKSSGLAYVTIATVLRRMEARKMGAHRVQNRAFIYQALVAEKEVVQNLAGDLLDRLFGGSMSALFNNLLSNREVDASELEALERMIRERKRKS